MITPINTAHLANIGNMMTAIPAMAHCTLIFMDKRSCNWFAIYWQYKHYVRETLVNCTFIRYPMIVDVVSCANEVFGFGIILSYKY